MLRPSRLLPVVGLLASLLFGCREAAKPAAVDAGPPPVDVSAQVLDAADAAACNDLDRATKEAKDALQKSPKHAGAAFILACVALERSDWDNAKKWITAMGPAPEAKVLDALLSVRRTTRDSWTDGFVRAWNQVGRPRISDSPLLLRDLSTEPTSTQTPLPSPLPPELHRLLALSRTAPDVAEDRWLLEQLAQSEDLTWIFAAWDHLSGPDVPDSLHEEGTKLVRARLEALKARTPDDMRLRVALLVAGQRPTEPLTAPERKELDAIATLSTWSHVTFADAARDAHRILSAAHVPNARGLALTYGVSAVTGPDWHIQKRALASQEALNPKERAQLGLALLKIGRMKAARTTFVERLAGSGMWNQGATLAGDAAQAQESSQRERDTQALTAARTPPAVDRWPLPSLHRELFERTLTDEIGLYTLLLK